MTPSETKPTTFQLTIYVTYVSTNKSSKLLRRSITALPLKGFRDIFQFPVSPWGNITLCERTCFKCSSVLQVLRELRASLGAVVKRWHSPDANRTAVVQFTDMLLQLTDYPACGRRHYLQMTGKSSQGRPFLFHLSPLDTVLSRYMLPSRSRTPVVHTLTKKKSIRTNNEREN